MAPKLTSLLCLLLVISGFSGCIGGDEEVIVTDADGDGIDDSYDAFPNDATEQSDMDADGVGDNADAFPHDSSETVDSDGDGVGDNSDSFPNDATEQSDMDADGVGDNVDECYSPSLASLTDASTSVYDNGCYSGFLDDDYDWDSSHPGHFQPGVWTSYGGQRMLCDTLLNVSHSVWTFTITYGVESSFLYDDGTPYIAEENRSDIVAVFTQDIYYFEDEVLAACEDGLEHFNGTYGDRVYSKIITDIDRDYGKFLSYDADCEVEDEIAEGPIMYYDSEWSWEENVLEYISETNPAHDMWENGQDSDMDWRPTEWEPSDGLIPLLTAPRFYNGFG